jgi:hypothetical protein
MASNNNVRAANLLNRFTEYRLTPGEMAIGISTPREVKIIGDVYLDIHWGNSSIELFNSEKLIEGYYTRFDIKNNEVEFQIDRSVRVLPGNKVKSVVWIDSITQQPRIIENASKYVFRSHLKNTSPRVRLRFSKPNPESKRAFEGLRLTASSIFEMASNIVVKTLIKNLRTT